MRAIALWVADVDRNFNECDLNPVGKKTHNKTGKDDDRKVCALEQGMDVYFHLSSEAPLMQGILS
jgi:hypothetical protein